MIQTTPPDPGKDQASKRIWWLASYPKSGNTWVRAFLSAYEHGELDINNIDCVIGDNQPYFHQVCSPAPVASLTEYETLTIRSAALVHLMYWVRQNPLIVKTHMANVQVDNMPLIPWGLTRGAIYIVRDPRDVVVSYADHVQITIDECIEFCESRTNTLHDDRTGLKHILSDWTTHVESWCAKSTFPVLMVRYEDMKRDPMKYFCGILEYMDISVDKAKAQKALELCSFERMRKQEDENGFRERFKEGKFFRRGIVGGWKDTLTEPQALRVEAAHNVWMKQLGYLDEHTSARTLLAANG